MANQLDRLSYLHAADYEYTSDLSNCVNPKKNLNDIFQAFPLDDIDVENLRVYLRVRPNLPEEIGQEEEDTQIDIQDEHSLVLTAPASSNTFKNRTNGITKISQKFAFSRIFDPTTTQKELFDESTLGLVRDFINGQNCLLFTYGATNSGKTYTVQGTESNVGILPRSLDAIFNTIGDQQYMRNDLKPHYFCNVIRLEEKDVKKENEKKERIFRLSSELHSTFSQSTMSISKLGTSDDSLDTTQQSTATESSRVLVGRCSDGTSLDVDCEDALYAVFVSYAEIYNEYIHDLFEKMSPSKNKRNPLMLGEDRNGAIYIKGLQEVRVNSAEEAWRLMEIGRQNLHFATTKLNHNSSRSHCIFTIKMIRVASADNPHVARVSMLSVCDLAGAERAAKTQSTSDRLKEAGNINTSLLVLSRCIDALRKNQVQKGSKKREVPVPYRDSKLTRLFQSFFLGHGKAAMIVNIAKAPLLFDETLQVLKFSAIAKQVSISQTRETECHVKPPKRPSHFSKFIRQSLNSSGRLSVPWSKRGSDITFGLSETSESVMETVQEDEEEEEDEKYEALIDLISKLKDQLLKEHKEKVDLEVRLREELCNEFSQQIVEIETMWSNRLKEQEMQSEELNEWRINALVKSMKKSKGGHKRLRSDDDPDDEYVSSLLYFQAEQKAKNLENCLKELEIENKNLCSEVEALRNSQKKISDQATKAQEEKSRITFQLAQLTQNLDATTSELEELRKQYSSSCTGESEAISNLQQQLKDSHTALSVKENEMKELKDMLIEAAEEFIIKDQDCENYVKKLESREKTITQQMMMVSELESQLNQATDMLSQRSAQVDERDQLIARLQRNQLSPQSSTDYSEIAELRQLAKSSQKEVSLLKKELLESELAKNETQKKMSELEAQKHQLEEEYLREKSKLLLEVASLKQAGGHTGNSKKESTEEVEAAFKKIAELQHKNEEVTLEKKHVSNELQELKEMFTFLQKNNKELQGDYDRQKKDLDELSSKLVTVQEQRAAELLDTSALKESTANAAQQVQTLQEQLHERNQYVTELEENICKLERQFKNLEAESTINKRAADDEMEARKQKIEIQEMTIKDLEMKIRDFEESKENIKHLNETINEIMTDKCNVTSERNSLKENLEKETEARKNQMETVEHLENELQSIKEDKGKKESEIEHLRLALEESDASHKEVLQSLDSIIKGLQSDKEILEKKLDEDISNRSAVITELQNKISESQLQEQVLKDELERLKLDLEAARYSKEETEDSNIALEAKVSSFKNELENVRLEYKDMEIKIQLDKETLEKKLDEDLSTKSAVMNELKNKISESQLQEQVLKDELERLKLDLEAARYSKEETEDSNIALEAKVSSLKNELKNVRLEYKDMEIKVESSQKSHTEQRSRVLEDNKALRQEIDRLTTKTGDLKSEVEELHKSKVTLESRLHELENSELNEQKCTIDTLSQNEKAAKEECSVLQTKIDELRGQLDDKKEIIVSLSTKLLSMDRKILQADKDLEEKTQTIIQDLQTTRERCVILEKEMRAVREARQEEITEKLNASQDREELLRQKDAEISSLQQEVKKLIQASVTSVATPSRQDSCKTPSVKKENTERDELIISLKEQIKCSEMEKTTLGEEVTSLRNQLEKMSIFSESCMSHSVVNSTTISSQNKDSCLLQLPTDADDSQSHQTSTAASITPTAKPRSSRPQRSSTRIRRTNPSYDQSYEESPRQDLHTIPQEDIWVPPASVTKPRSARKNTRGRKSRAQLTNPLINQESDSSHYNSLNFDSLHQDLHTISRVEEEDDTWEPPAPACKSTRNTRKNARGRKSKAQVFNPHINQENLSSIANKVDENNSENIGGKTPVQRRKRQLFTSIIAEPYECSPSQIELAPVQDSPHSVVRRQLRTKKK